MLVEKSCYLKEQNYTKLPKLFLVPETLFPLVKGIEGVLERAKRIWNAQSASGTASGLGTPEEPWNCPKGKWNAQSATGTARRANGTREAPLERPQGYFVLFVGRRYYLRPNPLRSPPLRTLWNAQSATGTAFSLLEQSLRLYLERPPGLWNSLRPLGTPAGG